MWWNNVETKPGTGFPTQWEDQLNFKGGWLLDKDRKLKLRSQDKADFLPKLFYNPNQPELNDYYEPWTYQYENLFDAPQGKDQPTAIPVSKITGEPIDIEAGPNWDDDLSGSQIYAKNDPNFEALTPQEREMLLNVERISMMYLPRICNHCANPSCVAACPSGALYKRGEDGIVLVNQDKCRGWRACVTACPYKKIYYNWKTGKSEKCILCYPRVETGQAPACFHTCVGRIRYMGVLLYDAERIEEAMKAPEEGLAEAQRSVLLDPHDPRVVSEALGNGISPGWIESAQKSPIWKFVVEWKMALPLHPEFRTLPMLYYVPPLSPVMGRMEGNIYEHDVDTLFTSIDKARLPIKYLAALFSAGNIQPVREAMKKLLAVRVYQRSVTLGDIESDKLNKILREAELSEAQAKEIYALSALPGPEERFMIPPTQREEAVENTSCGPDKCKGTCGLGQSKTPDRGL
jgi:nitrate reductase beta subunit